MLPENLYLLLIVFAASLYGLIRGADELVEGSSLLARRFGISDLVIGLTVIAFGTSLPELVVSMQASLAGKGHLALANVVGSNIANILLVLGVTAAITPITAPRRLKRDVPFKFVLSVGFMVMIALSTNILVVNNVIDTSARLERWGGLLLLAAFVVFVGRLLFTKDDLIQPDSTAQQLDQGPKRSMGIAAVRVTIGLVMIIVGGDFTVDSAVGIATLLGISETTIGMTIVALGTSLPELVASLAAARKGYADMAIGNVVGSNIMNLTLVLGLSGTISAIDIGAYETLDITIMSLVTLMFLGYVSRSSEIHIGRVSGLLWTLGYLAYMGFVALRTLGS